jgi:hypothetical protein
MKIICLMERNKSSGRLKMTLYIAYFTRSSNFEIMEAGCVVQKETPRNVGISLLCEKLLKIC